MIVIPQIPVHEQLLYITALLSISVIILIVLALYSKNTITGEIQSSMVICISMLVLCIAVLLFVQISLPCTDYQMIQWGDAVSESTCQDIIAKGF